LKALEWPVVSEMRLKTEMNQLGRSHRAEWEMMKGFRKNLSIPRVQEWTSEFRGVLRRALRFSFAIVRFRVSASCGKPSGLRSGNRWS
jgi:hypothetical protein